MKKVYQQIFNWKLEIKKYRYKLKTNKVAMLKEKSEILNAQKKLSLND